MKKFDSRDLNVRTNDNVERDTTYDLKKEKVYQKNHFYVQWFPFCKLTIKSGKT